MASSADIVRHEWPRPADAHAYLEGFGPETGIAIVPYDDGWPAAFALVADRIRDALGDRALHIEHVGSTSVPGLVAKPVIDIDVTVPDPADEPAWLPALERAQFALAVREPWWHEHRCLRGRDPRANVHVFGPESPELVRHRVFRDWLREHAADRAAYAEAKLAAAAAANAAGENMMTYTDRKQPVIREIYDRAFRALGLLP